MRQITTHPPVLGVVVVVVVVHGRRATLRRFMKTIYEERVTHANPGAPTAHAR
jgi:hypothetical protein